MEREYDDINEIKKIINSEEDIDSENRTRISEIDSEISEASSHMQSLLEEEKEILNKEIHDREQMMLYLKEKIKHK